MDREAFTCQATENENVLLVTKDSRSIIKIRFSAKMCRSIAAIKSAGLHNGEKHKKV